MMPCLVYQADVVAAVVVPQHLVLSWLESSVVDHS